jgi:mannose-6-phosphate isomerase-like protein (cupin superfamily)
MTQLKGIVPKGWGSEEIWATTDKYCGELMHFNTDARFSMHFHAEKDESWYVLSGQFSVHYIDTTDARTHIAELNPGDIWHNRPLLPHQLVCVSAGTIIEVSTADSVEDNYRIAPGDSQK